ncbi:cilia- and flagella-associated protein 251 [Punica granatum]|uniref:Cilia- and flagella-associated protein 251 n=1 Tax=Punica granatum TaxID=22663 RepID=A0A218Y391_PUNGR|nr:cilia- and flagella-associated protein 251 [Punica granatum]OWM91299.1 hypothetical protein CDL15_Pgr000243 [Punica granatum]
MVSSAAWILSMKALFISIGAASLAVFLKVSMPLVAEFMISQLPLLWRSVLSWLRPPYLYVVINAIIISIAASSKLHRSHDTSPDESPPAENGVQDDRPQEIIGGAVEPEGFRDLPVKSFPEEDAVSDSETADNNDRDEEEEEEKEEEEEEEEEEGKEEEEDFVISRSTWMPAKRSGSPVHEYLPQPSEKPLASSRFVHRRPAKSSPEGGKALKVTRPKRHETLENTWKAITEGRPMPLTRHRRKSDTWENGHHQDSKTQLSSPQQQKMRKSETFRDRTNELEQSPSSPGTMRRALSPGQDELNRRVEAFIRKFNEEMRLQRQESLNHYKQMISR